MPTCLAIGCANTTGKTRVKKSYYRVPRPNSDFEKARADRWLLNLQIGHTAETFDFTKDKVVCEDHFHVDCYQSRAYVPPSELPSEVRIRKRSLKEGALPTIFSNCVYDVINLDGTKASRDPSMTISEYFSRLYGAKSQQNVNGSMTQMNASQHSPDISSMSTILSTSTNFPLHKNTVTTAKSVTSFNVSPTLLPSQTTTTTQPLFKISNAFSLNYSTSTQPVHSFQLPHVPLTVESPQPSGPHTRGLVPFQITSPQQTALTVNLVRPPSSVSNNMNNARPTTKPSLTPNNSVCTTNTRSTYPSTNHTRPQLSRRIRAKSNGMISPDSNSSSQCEQRVSQQPLSNSKHQEPTVTSCGHLVCKLCVDNSNQVRVSCPTCKGRTESRTTGNMNNEMSDPKLKSQIRKTRIKLLFEDFQNELDYLENCNEEMSQENTNLKKENEELKKQLHEQETRYFESLNSTTGELENISTDAAENSDIKTILKLSNKLQEVMRRNENLTQANNTLKKELKHMRAEKERYLNEIKSLKDENQSKGHHRRSRFSMDVLRTKVDGYEREIQQWKKVLKRSDEQIEELTASLENYKNYGVLPAADNQLVTSSESLHESNEKEAGSSRIANDATTTTNSASAMLVNLANASSPACKQRRNNTTMEESNDKRVEQMNNSTAENHNTISSPPVAVKTDNHISGEPFLDPDRFPACRKLMELNKARQESVESGTLSGQLSRSRNSSKSSESPRSNGSPQLPFAARDSYGPGSFNENADQQMYPEDENGDEITVVLPSNEFPLETTNDITSQNDHDENVAFKAKPSSPPCTSSSSSSLSISWSTGSQSGDDAYDGGNSSESRTTNSNKLVTSSNSPENGLYQPAIKKIKTESIY